LAHCKSWHAKSQRPVGAVPRKLSFACNESSAPPNWSWKGRGQTSERNWKTQRQRWKHSTLRTTQHTHTYIYSETEPRIERATSWSFSFFGAFVCIFVYCDFLFPFAYCVLCYQFCIIIS